jgi:FkbM family methyltransferase
MRSLMGDAPISKTNKKSIFARTMVTVGRRMVLPGIVRALRLLPAQAREYVFRQEASELGVATISCDGELGMFEGDVRDQVIHAVYLATKTWTPEYMALVRDHVLARGGGTLIDVGANIGLTSIPVARARNTVCHVFEPDPQNHALLLRNAAANGVQSLVHAYNVAVMEREGTLTLERSSDNMGDHRIRVTPVTAGAYGEERRSLVQVAGRPLDACLAGQPLAGPVVLKVDTQGAEARVFRGATATLDRVDVLFAEYWPYGLRRMEDTPEAFFSAVSRFPYGGIVRGMAPPTLEPTAVLVEQLRAAIPMDGSTIAQVDIILSRTPAIG